MNDLTFKTKLAIISSRVKDVCYYLDNMRHGLPYTISTL